MKKISFTNEELKYLQQALDFYCDETTHERKDLGEFESSPGLNPNSRESKVLDKIRNKITALSEEKK